jgi:chromosome segregation ATPase
LSDPQPKNGFNRAWIIAVAASLVSGGLGSGAAIGYRKIDAKELETRVMIRILSVEADHRRELEGHKDDHTEELRELRVASRGILDSIERLRGEILDLERGLSEQLKKLPPPEFQARVNHLESRQRELERTIWRLLNKSDQRGRLLPPDGPVEPRT